MTFIFGVNLCDRIYVSGDTRLTRKKSSGEVENVKDNLIKVEPLSKDVVLAAAGGASMAAFLIRKMLKSDLVKMDIRLLRANIQTTLAPFVDEYWKSRDGTESVTFIFGGIDKGKKKQFNSAKVHEKIMQFSHIDEGKASMVLRPALFNVMVEQRYPEPSDSHVFSVQINPPNEFIITDAEWGSYLAYGPRGITKDDLPGETFGKLEFVQGNDAVGHDNMIICAATKTIAKDKQAETIGGAVIVGIVSDEISGVVGGAVYLFDPKANKMELVSNVINIGGTFYRKDENGTHHRLQRLKDYKDFGLLEI
jgi:hypothetical protein